MKRTKLTDRLLRSLKPAADMMDTVVDRLGVKVTGDNGKAVLTFYLYTRFPETDPTKPPRTLMKGAGRRVLGVYCEDITRDREPTDDELLDLRRLTLAEARRTKRACGST